MPSSIKRPAATSAAMALVLAATSAAAQDWPTQTITMIVPFPAAGATDLVARRLGDGLSQALGQPVIIENRPGAAGSIGTTVAARAEPDGHTLLVGTVGTHGINPSLYNELQYDAVEDFEPVILLQSAPNVIVVNNDLPIETIDDLIEYAREQGGALNFASSGIGTSLHLSAEMFKHEAGITMEHVPYTGSAQVLPSVISGETELAFDNLPPAYPQIVNGSLRAIAVTTQERSEALPDVPTIAESATAVDLSGFEASTWFALFAPAGTAPEIVARLNELSNEILSDPETIEFFAIGGGIPGGGSPDDLAAHVASEIERWGAVIEGAGIPKQ